MTPPEMCARPQVIFQHLLKKIMRSRGISLSDVTHIFKEIDADGSGMIDREELSTFISKMEIEMNEKDVGKLWESLDVLDQGQISYSALAEFLFKDELATVSIPVDDLNPEVLYGEIKFDEELTVTECTMNPPPHVSIIGHRLRSVRRGFSRNPVHSLKELDEVLQKLQTSKQKCKECATQTLVFEAPQSNEIDQFLSPESLTIRLLEEIKLSEANLLEEMKASLEMDGKEARSEAPAASVGQKKSVSTDKRLGALEDTTAEILSRIGDMQGQMQTLIEKVARVTPARKPAARPQKKPSLEPAALTIPTTPPSDTQATL